MSLQPPKATKNVVFREFKSDKFDGGTFNERVR